MKAQRIIWALNRLPRFGIQTFKRLQEKNPSLAELSESEILGLLAQLDPDFPEEFSRILNSSEWEQEFETCAQSGIHLLSITDPLYPKNLVAIFDPPLILYVKGNFIPEDQYSIAIVGSRYPSAYGIRMAAQFSSALTERGITIVSGFARGIDGEAHRSCLRSKGRTIAVLGCGLDVIYPKEHSKLYLEIVESGAIISEFPLGTIPESFNFPRRNRIITGLSMGVLVVEASRKSGSLITASIAAEEGREVYAIPGQADAITAQGTNHLIQNGAKLVTSADDILEDLSPQLMASLEFQPDCHSERSEESQNIDPSAVRQAQRTAPQDNMDPVLKLLEKEPLSLDEIMTAVQESPGSIYSRLTKLEMEGRIKRMFGGKYVRTPDIAIT